MNTDAPTAGGYLVGVVAAVDVDANQTIQTRSGRRSIRGAVAFAGGSGVECRICGAREWLLVPTLGTSSMEQEAIDESNGRPGHVCIGASAANYVRAAREAAARGEKWSAPSTWPRTPSLMQRLSAPPPPARRWRA